MNIIQDFILLEQHKNKINLRYVYQKLCVNCYSSTDLMSWEFTHNDCIHSTDNTIAKPLVRRKRQKYYNQNVGSYTPCQGSITHGHLG